jgi:dihydropyrimidinase
MVELVIHGGTCINAGDHFEADLVIDHGKIVQIGWDMGLVAQQSIDARGKLVLPGVVDTHVHLPWPSAAYNSTDDYLSGTKAAACGGVTTIVEYVVPDESGRLIPALEERKANAEHQAYVDYSFHMIIRRVTPETLQDMAEIVRQGFTSFKVYTAYQGFQLGDADILNVLQTARGLGALTCFHAEDGSLVNAATEQLAELGHTAVRYYSEAHPRAADVEGVHRILTYARYLDAPIHIVHVNTAEGARMIAEARTAGQTVTGETCPHYLMFNEDIYRSGTGEAAYFVLAPAIREERDRIALWHAITVGSLQTIATDHCPYTSQQKTGGGDDFRRVPGGAGGVETSLRLLYTYGVRGGQFSWEKLVEVMCTNPARLFRLYPQKGTIAVGSDADLVIYDPTREYKIEGTKLHSNTDHSIYQDIPVWGNVVATILRGQVVAKDGELSDDRPKGTLLQRSPYPKNSPIL